MSHQAGPSGSFDNLELVTPKLLDISDGGRNGKQWQLTPLKYCYKPYTHLATVTLHCNFGLCVI